MGLNELYKVELLGQAGNRPAVNVLHYVQSTADVGTSGEQGLIDTWVTDVWLGLKTAISNFYELQTIRVTNLTQNSVPVEQAINEAGTNVTQAGPNQSAVVVSWRTDQRGRSYRGRNYFAGIPEANVVGSVISPAPLAEWQGHADNMISVGDDILTPIYQLVIYSKVLVGSNPVVTGIARSVTGTIRNRRP